MLVFIMVNILFINDKKLGMDKVIDTTLYGKNKLNLTKINTIVLLIVVLSVLYRVVESIVFFVLYGYDGLLMPLYSVTEYTNTFFNGTILSAFILDIVMKIVGCTIIALIIILSVLVIKNTACAYVVALILSLLIKLPIILFDNYALFKDNTLYVLGGLVVNRLDCALIASCILILILYILFCVKYRKRRVKLCGNMN